MAIYCATYYSSVNGREEILLERSTQRLRAELKEKFLKLVALAVFSLVVIAITLIAMGAYWSGPNWTGPLAAGIYSFMQFKAGFDPFTYAAEAKNVHKAKTSRVRTFSMLMRPH